MRAGEITSLRRHQVDLARRAVSLTDIKNGNARTVPLSLRFHDLHHEAVFRLIEVGLGDQEVASISGHKSMQMFKRYTHLRAEDLVKRRIS